jgi:hypothetical protein
MSIPASTLRLWVLHFVGNAILLLGFYAWLSIGDANAAQLAGTIIYGVSIAFLAIWLYDGTLLYFSAGPRERLFTAFSRSMRTLIPFAVVVVVAVFVYWLLSSAGDQLSDTAATAASWLTLKLRRPVKPAGILHVLTWLLRVVEWFGAPLLLIPLASSVAVHGWRGFGSRRFAALRRRYALECTALLIAAFFVPWLITHWVPGLYGMTLQTVSALVRFAVAYVIFVTASLLLACNTAAPQRPAEPAVTDASTDAAP